MGEVMNAARDSVVRHGSLAGWLLRSPAEAAQACRGTADLRPLVVTCLAAIAIGGAAFGAVVGSFRGGAQVIYAAAKVPIAVLLALALCVPAFHALAAVFGRPWRLGTVVAIALASCARASLLLLALSPLLWLAYDLGLGYHAAAAAAAAAYGASGLTAMGVLLRGLGPGRGRLLTVAAFATVFMAAAGQTSWALRPYLVRPRTSEPPFVRAPEGNFIEALWTVGHSAVGIYSSHAPAPLPEERYREGYR
jgi:hypothetical protein